MTQTNEADKHQNFIRQLKASQPAVFAVAKHFNLTGYDTLVPGVRAAPTPGEWKQFSDEGDLFIRNRDDGRAWQRWEVKHRRRWLNAPTYSFPDVYIERAARVDRMKVKPFAWALVSNDLRWATIAFYENFEGWWRAPIKGPEEINHVQVEEMFWCKVDETIMVELL